MKVLMLLAGAFLTWVAFRPTPEPSLSHLAGWQPMADAEVTPEMRAWAVAILQDERDYPMGAVAQQYFGSVRALARVEWHPPDFQSPKVHRGVTLYRRTPVG